MNLCPHGYEAPCWMCDGLHECDYVQHYRALAGWTHEPHSKQCTAWYALPPDVEPRRNQDIPTSAGAGDYYLSSRGQVWLLCARGPNWSLVMRVDRAPEDATVIRPARLRAGAAKRKEVRHGE